MRRKDCSYAFEGQMCSLSLSEIKRKNEVRRGMVLIDAENLDQSISKSVCYSFEAHIDVLNHCTLRENSQPIIHIENIRQSAHILHIHSSDSKELRHGQNGDAVFTFIHHPEFIRVGMKIIIRKSHGPIAIGRVARILDDAQKPLVPLNSLQKPHRLRMSKSQTIKSYLKKWNLEKKKKQKEAEELRMAESMEQGTEKETFSTSEEEVKLSDTDCHHQNVSVSAKSREKIIKKYGKVFKKRYEKKESVQRDRFSIRNFVGGTV